MVKGMKKGEKGFSLVEVVIAIGVLAIVAATIVTYFAWSFRVFGYVDVKATAESLARSQMEYIKAQPYSENGTYTRIDLGSFPGYDIPWPPSVDNVTSGLQKITVTVIRTYFEEPGEQRTENVTLEGYKLNR